MKMVALLVISEIKTIDVLRTVVNRDQRGATIDDIRKRCKLMDKLDTAESEKINYVIFTDEEFSIIKDCVNSYRFPFSSKDLLQVCDKILTSEEPPMENIRALKKYEEKSNG